MNQVAKVRRKFDQMKRTHGMRLWLLFMVCIYIFSFYLEPLVNAVTPVKALFFCILGSLSILEGHF